MKILYLTTHLNTGGITSYLFTLTREMQSLGHKAFVISSGGNMENAFRQAGITCLTLDIKTKSELSLRLYRALPGIKRFVEAEGIDIIHAQTRVTQVLGYFLNKMTKTAFCTTCHGFFKPHIFRRLFSGWGNAVIAISPAVSEHLKVDFHVPEDRVALVKNGLMLEDFPLLTSEQKLAKRESLGLSAGPIVGIIARMSDVKGHNVLIAAMPAILQKFPEATLVIVGQGKMEEKIRQQVKELKLEACVRFFPVVNQTAEMLSVFDCFVMPSLQEGLGLSVMEAQGAGLAVVASRVGGIPSLVQDGVTGRLVPPGDPVALAQAIIGVLADPTEARAMGERAREFVGREFSALKMAEETLDVYQKLL